MGLVSLKQIIITNIKRKRFNNNNKTKHLTLLSVSDEFIKKFEEISVISQNKNL